MSIFKTETPTYKKQKGQQLTSEISDWLGWFSQLFRTPTPNYKSAPSRESREKS